MPFRTFNTDEVAQHLNLTGADIDRLVKDGDIPFEKRDALLPELIRPDTIAPAMTAKTKASVVRDMAALANRTGLVCDAAELIASLLAREKLCSTAMPGGVAFLHPRQVQPYLFQSSFLVFGRTIQPFD